MRRAKRITALAVAAAMVLSNVAYAAPDTNTTTTQQGAESLNSQSDASGGVKDQASDTKGNTSTSASQSKEQVKQNESSQSTDPGDQKQTDSKADVVSQNQDQKKDEDSKETQKPSTEADSQKSETQNVDADKSEDTQEPSKEQEKVLYDITFDTPEKHGRVTDLDGKEVADGKTLKTDENGKVKFKVKPDDGYQVQAVYQMPDEQTPLKLVTDSYYEMQVEKNTTVKVVYQKIPASEEESDGEEAGETVAEENGTEQKGNSVNVQETPELKSKHQKAENTKQDEKQIDVLAEKDIYEGYVGETIQITGKEKGIIPKHEWGVKQQDRDDVQLLESDKKTVKIKGLKAKENIEITHKYRAMSDQTWRTEIFTVSIKNLELKEIRISGSSDMVVGTNQKLSAALLPKGCDQNTQLEWKSTNPSVASVDNSGKVTAKALGTTTITASAGMIVSNEIQITVTNEVEAQQVIITSEFDRVYVNGSKTMTAYVSPSTTTDKTLEWSVNNAGVAHIDRTTGTITGIKPGEVKVTVTTKNGLTASKNIDVVNATETEPVYFYGIRQGKDPNSLNGDDYFYIGKGLINTEGLYVPNGSYEMENVNDYIISSPNDEEIKNRVIKYYNVSDPDKVKITYSFYKITHPNGWTDENGNSYDSNKQCYHVDMDISVEMLEQASVTFSLKDAGQNSFETMESFMVDKGNQVSPLKEYLAQKTVGGVTYYFDGWYDNPLCYGAKVTIPYTVNEASRLYAQYVAQQYTLTYNSNGGQGTAPEGGRFASGTEAKVSEAAGLTREGYTFIEWNTSSNGNGTGYQPGSSLVFKNSDITLYAIWKRDTSGFSVEGVNTTYDGKSHTISIAGNLLVGEKWQYKDGNQWKDAKIQNGQFGNYVNAQNTSVEFRVVNKDNDVIWRNTAQVTIGKRDVTLTSGEGSKQYDGKPLTNDEVTVSGDGFVGKEGATYTVTGSQTVVGSSQNSFTYELKAGTKAENYNIQQNYGTLTVTNRDAKYEITVVAKSGGEKYNGKEQTVSGFETTTFNVEGNNYTVEGLTAEAKATDAGEYPVNVVGTAVVKDAEGNVVTDQFAVKTQNGKLTIGKRDVTLTSGEGSKQYDGKPLTNDEVTVSGDGFVGKEGATYTVTGSQTVVGSSQNSFTYELKAGTKAENYNIQQNYGTLTVTNRDAKYEITVVAKSGGEKYNGKEQTVSGFETTTFNVEGNNYTVEGLTAEAKATDAGEYPVNVVGTAVVKDAEGNVVTDQFAVKTQNGKLTITQKPIKITDTKTENYDGTEKVLNLTADKATGVVEGETLTLTGAAIKGRAKGEYKEVSKYTWSVAKKDQSDSTGNYTIEVSGTLTINQGTAGDLNANVTIEGWTYDGKFDAKESLQATSKSDGDLSYTYYQKSGDDWKELEKEPVDAGDYKVVASWTETENSAAVSAEKEFTIQKASITVTTESASKTYDASALTAPGEVEGIVEGETYGFEITGSQTLVGTSENSYVMTWAGEGNEYSAKSDNYTVTERVGTLTVTDGSEEEPINPEDVVKKTHGTPEGGVYKAGDVVTFTVTATNIYDEVKTITLNEIAGVTLKDTVFADVQPGETVETTATYTITEADVLAGEFVNTVTASFSGEEDTPFEDDDQVDEIEEPKGHLTIDKVTTSEPANGSSYALGETITYKITATNDGNLTLTNVKVVDELTGDEWEIASLAPGASEEYDTSYTVTEADILAGSVVNTATAEGTSPDPDKPDVPVNPGEEEEPTETEKPSLFVEKTAQPDEDGVYNLGDEIHYVIKVTNNGNVTVNDITVKDELTGDEWQLDSLTPGESEEYHATYTVTEEDILAGSITNVATAEGTDPDEDPVDQEGEETVPTDSADSHLTIHKATTSDPGDDGVYDLGDTITYEIIAANDGNVTLNNVVVTDELTGDEWIIETLAPGVSETFEAEYVVTEEDIHNGSVVNEATATAEGPEEPVITPGETEDETNPENPSLTVDKSIVEEKDEYEIGDVIEYEITVANNGNVTQNDVRVTDLLQAAGDIVITGVEGADGEIDGAIVTLDSLAPGESATIHCEYTVLKEDRGSTITNAAIADDEGKGDGEDPVTPDVPAEVADVYDINVVHQFADGEEGEAELPDDYTIENQPVGTEREITAETVEGYTVSPASQEVTIEDSDVTITFVYYADEIGTDPENPDTPDNVPDRYQAVVTFEAVNGTVDRSAAVVTLMRNGQPAEDGTGYLTEDQIATARANVGYAQNSLTWSPGTPTAEYKVTGDMTFTASFSAIPVIPGDGGEEPVEPTNPTTPTTPARPSTPTTPTLPVTPANPGTTVTPTLPVTPQTAAPAALVYADGVVVDDPQTATDDYDLNEVERDAGTETIDEDSTPLGNMDLEKDDDHKCCILHFILLLLALIVELIYTHDRKKRQERIFELRRELADFDETV